MDKPKCLDLFSKAGGTSMGYYRAGFDVTGVDIQPQKHYPFKFIQADALEYLESHWQEYDFIAASPPCQAYSDLQKRTGLTYPDLIAPLRDMMILTNKPYVIENVPEAPLINPVVLCGTMFHTLRVIRHRAFESNLFLWRMPHDKKHPLVFTKDKRKTHYGKLNEFDSFVQVTGGGNCSVASAADAMGIDWMTKAELNQAIPPAYTEFIGRQIIELI